MATISSRINYGVTLLGAILAGYILWQFLTIYANAFRFQDTVSGISYRDSESQKRPEEIREHVLAAAAILHLPLKKKSVEVYIPVNSFPQINAHYAQPVDLLFTTTYMRCHVNTNTVDIWFSSKPEEDEEQTLTPPPAVRRRS